MQEDGVLGLASGSPGHRFPRKFTDDAEHVLLEDGADGHGGGEVIGPDVAEGGEVAVFHHPEGSEDHSYAEGAHRQAADRSDGIVSEDGVVFGLYLVEMLVEVLALLCRKTNFDAGVLLQAVIKGEELTAKDFEKVVQGFTVSFVQDIEPNEGFIQAVEEKAGKQTVLHAGHQVGDLLGRAG